MLRVFAHENSCGTPRISERAQVEKLLFLPCRVLQSGELKELTSADFIAFSRAILVI